MTDLENLVNNEFGPKYLAQELCENGDIQAGLKLLAKPIKSMNEYQCKLSVRQKFDLTPFLFRQSSASRMRG